MNFLDLSGPLDFIRVLVEVSLVSYIVYKVIQLVRETRAMQLVKGILFILILSRVSEIIGLRTVAFLMQSAIQLFGFGMIVLFQPELRRALEKLGSSGFQDILLKRDDEERLKTIASIEAIVKACASCAEDYIGAPDSHREGYKNQGILSARAPGWTRLCPRNSC